MCNILSKNEQIKTMSIIITPNDNFLKFCSVLPRGKKSVINSWTWLKTKVSILGVQSLLPFSAWLFPGCKNNIFKVGNSTLKFIDFKEFKSQQIQIFFTQINNNFFKEKANNLTLQKQIWRYIAQIFTMTLDLWEYLSWVINGWWHRNW